MPRDGADFDALPVAEGRPVELEVVAAAAAAAAPPFEIAAFVVADAASTDSTLSVLFRFRAAAAAVAAGCFVLRLEEAGVSAGAIR